MVKSTGEALLDADGNAITATKTLQPRQKAGEVKLEFTFDSSLLAGEDIVAFESALSEGVEVVSTPTSQTRARPCTSSTSIPTRPTRPTATSW